MKLNRRLSPDVYLGVAKVSDVDGASGEPLVVMRRMPEERRLSALVRSATPLADAIATLAKTIAAFHGKAEGGEHVDAEGTREALAARWDDSFAQVESLADAALEPGLLAEIERHTRTFLAGRARRCSRPELTPGGSSTVMETRSPMTSSCSTTGPGCWTASTPDPAPPSLRDHYIAYRAFVRVKVACLRHAQ